MTVYVDDMYRYPMGQFRRMKMSHMIADTEEELHVMADKINLARKWYQGDHYDVSIGYRRDAIRHGAVPITLRELAAKAMEIRRSRRAVQKEIQPRRRTVRFVCNKNDTS